LPILQKKVRRAQGGYAIQKDLEIGQTVTRHIALHDRIHAIRDKPQLPGNTAKRRRPAKGEILIACKGPVGIDAVKADAVALGTREIEDLVRGVGKYRGVRHARIDEPVCPARTFKIIYATATCQAICARISGDLVTLHRPFGIFDG
jgi:hypothetical protein